MFRRSVGPHSLDDPRGYPTFQRHLDPSWIEEALATTGTATLRKRRLPAERVVWLVIGMALLRDRPIAEVVRQLDLAMPSGDVAGPSPRGSVSQARTRLGPGSSGVAAERTATFAGRCERRSQSVARAGAVRARWHHCSRARQRGVERAHFGGQEAASIEEEKNRGASGTHW
ncbi:MAG: transposase domain-containing protein [Myxococcales bacterium]|nr:transposase domain-containing protein [Myxococcales bacterium]